MHIYVYIYSLPDHNDTQINRFSSTQRGSLSHLTWSAWVRKNLKFRSNAKGSAATANTGGTRRMKCQISALERKIFG